MNLSTQAAGAMLVTWETQFNSGNLVFYSGTMPTSPETPLSGNTALATFNFTATAFGSNSFSGGFQQGSASFANATVTPSAAGTVTFARGFKSDGTTVITDFTVGTSGTDIIIANTALQTTVQVTLNPFVLKMPAV